MATSSSPHTVLGLQPSASKDQVKEAFRKLVWQHHPDKVAPELRTAAEAKFKEIKLAYEAILEQEAGYRPPPPGSAPNMHSAEAYWHTHSTDGRVPWGKYAGFETEMAFYRAMLKGGRNNMAILAVLGLMAIPTVAAGTAIIQSWQREDPEEAGQGGLDSMRPDAYVVNGRVTQHNPWAASSQDAMIKYRELIKARKIAEQEAAAAAGGGGSSSGGSVSSSSSGSGKS